MFIRNSLVYGSFIRKYALYFLFNKLIYPLNREIPCHISKLVKSSPLSAKTLSTIHKCASFKLRKNIVFYTRFKIENSFSCWLMVCARLVCLENFSWHFVRRYRCKLSQQVGLPFMNFFFFFFNVHICYLCAA